MQRTVSLVITLSLLVNAFVCAPVDNDIQQSYTDEEFRKTCPQCKSAPAPVRVRRDEATNSLIATLAQEFVARGGVQALAALATSQDKMGTLKSIMGNQVQGAVLGQGVLSRLVSIYRGGGGGGAGYVNPPSRPTSGSGMPQPAEGDGRWDPSPAATGGRGAAATGGGAANPDDTEY